MNDLTKTQKSRVRKWTKALRSGEYKQCKGVLKRRQPAGHNTYCCLGVAIEVCGTQKEKKELLSFRPGMRGRMDSNSASMPATSQARLGLTFGLAGTLMNLNDTQKKSFKFIADYIEDQML